MDIINCKDCIFFGTDIYKNIESYACFYFTNATLTIPDGFCHRARNSLPTEKELLEDVRSSVIRVIKREEK